MPYGRHAAPQVARASRWGSTIYRFRWWVVGGWMVALAAGMPALSQISANLTAGGFEVPGSDSAQVAELMQSPTTGLAGQFERTSVLVLHSPQLTADDPAYQAALTAGRNALLAAPGVAAVSGPAPAPGTVSADGHTVVLTVGIDEPQDLAYAHAPVLQDAVRDALAGTGIVGNLAGDAPFYAAFQSTGSADLSMAEMIVAPISLLILVLALGALVSALVPLLLAGTAVAIALSLVSVLGAHVTVNLFTQNIATMIGLGVGIDYCLFVLRPFREALRQRHSPQGAVCLALAGSARGVIISALTVVFALSGTLLVDVPAYRSMGLGAMIAVAVAAAAAVTLLPAMLSILGHRVEAGRVWRRQSGRGAKLLERVAGGATRRPWVSAVGALVLLGVLAVPALRLQLGTSGPAMLPADSAPRQAAEQLADGFGAGMPSPLKIAVGQVAGSGTVGDLPAGVASVIDAVQADPEVATVLPAELGNGVTLLTVITRHGPQAPEVLALVESLRQALPSVLGTGLGVLVGGEPAQNLDLNDQVGGSVPVVVAAVLLMSLLLLLLAFRSLFIAAKAVLTTLLSVLAVYGVLVLVFQDGIGAGLLGVQAPGFVEVFLPLFLFCILFGLSMDYEVFLLTEVRREYLAGASTAAATTVAVRDTAGVITTAAAIMVSVFGAFAFTSLTPIQAIGFGLAVAVLLDATVVRLILVPAALVLLGDRNFWLPRWLDEVLPGERRRPGALPVMLERPLPHPPAHRMPVARPVLLRR